MAATWQTRARASRTIAFASLLSSCCANAANLATVTYFAKPFVVVQAFECVVVHEPHLRQMASVSLLAMVATNGVS